MAHPAKRHSLRSRLNSVLRLLVLLAFLSVAPTSLAQSREGLSPASTSKDIWPDGAPNFLDTSIHPAIGVEGVYYVEVDDMPNVSAMYLRITKGGEYTNSLEAMDGFVRNPDAIWELQTRAIYPGEKGLTNGIFETISEDGHNGRLRVAEDGTITFNHAYAQRILPAGFKVTLSPGENFDTFAGEWEIDADYRGDSPRRGDIRMHRLKPVISEVRVAGMYKYLGGRQFDGEPPIHDRAPFGARPLNVTIPENWRTEFQPGEACDQRLGPNLRIEVYGTELWSGDYGWGYLWVPPDSGMEIGLYDVSPLEVERNDGTEEIVGIHFPLRLLDCLREGQTIVYFNGNAIPLNVDFAWTEQRPVDAEIRSLDVVGLTGKPLDTLRDGESFRLRARVRGDAPAASIAVQVAEDPEHPDSGFSVTLNQIGTSRDFESEVLTLHRMVAERSLFREELGSDWDAARSADIIARRFRGQWDVASGSSSGLGSISTTGDTVWLNLGTDEAPAAYVSTDAYAEEERLKTRSFARLRTIMQRRPDLDRVIASGTNFDPPPGRSLSIGEWRTKLKFESGGQSTSVRVMSSEVEDKDAIQLSLYSWRPTSNLIADWSVPDPQTGAYATQRQNWSRHNPVEIHRVVLLDDQLGARKNPDNPDPEAPIYHYPFDAQNAATEGQSVRTLVVFGKALPNQKDARIESATNTITYALPPLPPDFLQAYRLGAHQLAGTEIAEGETWLVVQAHLKPGISPGVQQLSINDRVGHWSLAFSDAVGSIRFLRDGTTPRDLEERQFYSGEAISVGVVTTNQNLPMNNLSLTLEAVRQVGDEPAERRPLGVIELASDIGVGGRSAVSEAFVVKRAGSEDFITQPGLATLELVEFERLSARLSDPTSLIAIPPVATVQILHEPIHPELWRSALGRVMRCPDVMGSPSDLDFLTKSYFSTSRTIATSGFENREARVTNGDHAAMILIRDQLVPMVEDANAKLAPFLSNPNKQRAALQYLNSQRDLPGALATPFWASRHGMYTYRYTLDRQIVDEEISFALAEAVDIPALRDRINARIQTISPNGRLTDIPTVRDLALDAIATNMQAQYDDTQAALARARAAGDCNIEELLVIAGQKSDLAVSQILSQLVVKTPTGWEPDTVARAYVRTVHIVGSEIRALEEWGDIDDAYKSMAIAAGTAILTGGGSLVTAVGWSAGAEAAAAGIALAVNATDAIYFASKDLSDYFGAEEDYQTALGLSPVLGSDVIAQAEGRRSSALVPAISVLAPAIGGLADLSALRTIRRVNKGREVTRALSGADEIDALTQAERAQVASYYQQLKETESARLGVLLRREREDLALLEDFVRAKGVEPPPADVLADEFTGPSGTELFTDQVFPPLKPEAAPERFNDPLNEIFGDLDGPVIRLEDDADDLFNPIADLEDFRRVDEEDALTIDLDDLFDEALSPNAAYADGLRDRLDRNQSAPGRIDVQPDTIGNGTRRVLPSNTEVRNADGEIVIQIGERFDGGGLTSVYRDLEGAGESIIKARRIGRNNIDVLAREDDPGTAIDAIVDVEIGRRLLTDTFESSSIARVARLEGEPLIVENVAEPGVRYMITREENISSPLVMTTGDPILNADGNPVLVTDFARRVALRGEPPTDAEILTQQLAIRELNQNGLYWTDQKHGNFDIVRDSSSPTGYRLIFFDFDGIRPVLVDPNWSEQEAAVRRWERARRAQVYMDNAIDEASLDFEGRYLFEVESITDYSPFAVGGMHLPVTVHPDKVSQVYRRVNDLDAFAFEDLLSTVFRDGQVPYRNLEREEALAGVEALADTLNDGGPR